MAKIYFFDKYELVSCEGFEFAPPPIQKLGVALESREVIKDGYVQNFCSPVIPLDGGGYRMYYTIHGSRFNIKNMKIGIAHSASGIKWKRENLAQVFINGNNTPYIKIKGVPDNAGCVQPSVMKLPNGKWRMYFWLHGERIRYVAAESSDGINWETLNIDSPCLYHPSDKNIRDFFGGWEGLIPYKTASKIKKDKKEAPDLKRLISNDATFTYFNKETDKFEMYSVWLLPNEKGNKRFVPYDNAPSVLRTIHRRISSDGLNWSDPELIIYPNEKDSPDMQFYHLAVNKYEGWNIGFLGRYPCKKQTMDVEITFSRDGRKWHRPLRCAWIKRGKSGSRDSKGIYPSSNLIDMGRYRVFYYTGTARLHNEYMLKNKADTSIMLAKFLKNRFIGLKTKENNKGTLETQAFIPSDEKIFIDADIKGSLRGELCNAFGETISGFEFKNSVPVKGDSDRHILKWKNKDTSIFQYKALSLKLKIDSGTIFCIYS